MRFRTTARERSAIAVRECPRSSSIATPCDPTYRVMSFAADSGNVDVGDAAVDDCIRRILSCHRSLVFRPPIGDDDLTLTSTSATVRGVATKYDCRADRSPQPRGNVLLNSQLQCLAQNLGFVSGLFSWRKRRRSPSSYAAQVECPIEYAIDTRDNEVRT